MYSLASKMRQFFLTTKVGSKLTPMDDFTQNYLSIVPRPLACAIIHRLGGWDRFCGVATYVNKGEGAQSVVENYINKTNTDSLFDAHRHDVKLFFETFFQSYAQSVAKVVFIGDRDILCGDMWDVLDGRFKGSTAYADVTKYTIHHATQILCLDYLLYDTVN